MVPGAGIGKFSDAGEPQETGNAGISGVWNDYEIRWTIGQCPTRQPWNRSSEISSHPVTAQTCGVIYKFVASFRP